jgi:hypothetical protein
MNNLNGHRPGGECAKKLLQIDNVAADFMESAFQHIAGSPYGRAIRCRWQAFFITSPSSG